MTMSIAANVRKLAVAAQKNVARCRGKRQRNYELGNITSIGAAAFVRFDVPCYDCRLHRQRQLSFARRKDGS